MTLQIDGRHRLETSRVEAGVAEHLAVCDGQAVVGLHDGALRFGQRVVRAHEGPLVTVRAIGEHVLTAGRDGIVALWTLDGRPLAARTHPTGPLCAASMSDATVVLGDDEGFVFGWDLHTDRVDWVGDVRIPLTALAVQDDLVFMGTADGVVHVDGLSDKRHRGAVLDLYAVGGPDPLSVGADGRVRLGRDLLIRVSGSLSHSALWRNQLVLVSGRELQQWDLRRMALVRRTRVTAGEVVDIAMDASGVWILLDGEQRPRHWA
jgi:hypothetical protein